MSRSGRLVWIGLAALALSAAAPARAVEAEGKDFGAWLAGFRAEAADKGIRAETLDAAFAGVEPIPRVIELDRRQPEFTLTFNQYRGRVVTPAKVEKGRRLLAENRTLLAEIGRRYGVQPRFVVALWGIETDFGRVTGGFPVVAALATLAYDGRRSSYFRKELLNAVTILDQGHIEPKAMIGSWAGAMGQCQFMPSTFLRWAQDWDGDGRRDIWTNRADALASAANYLSGEGWKGDETWGRKVKLPKGFDEALVGPELRKSLDEWARLGVRRADGGALPTRAGLQASIVRPEAGKGPAFLVYDNFRTIMKWNRSTFFALTVGHLADRLAGG